MSKYIEVSKIFNKLDRNKQRPELIFIDGNRSSGKTVSTNRFALQRFLDGKGQFLLLYRYQTELVDIADRFYNEIYHLGFFTGIVTSESCNYNAYHKIYYQEDKDSEKICCGFAVAINTAEKVKKQAMAFRDVTLIIYDEFQSENGNYCPNEVRKFVSIHMSVARGGGQSHRFVPCLLLGNACDMYNPYYSALKIPDTIFNGDTKTYRGDGFVLNFYHSAEVAEEVKTNKVASLLDTDYMEYATGNKQYLNNSTQLILKQNLNDYQYFMGLYSDGQYFALYSNKKNNLFYLCTKVDKSRIVRAVDKSDVDINNTLLPLYERNVIKQYFQLGKIYCENEKCVDCLYNIV